MSVDTGVDLVGQFTDAIRKRAAAESYGEGQLLTLPWSLHDGESVAILVEEVAPGLYRLSDRGLAADSLALAGLDLSSKRAAPSWEAVRRSLKLRPSVIPPASRFELSGDATADELGTALTELAETILRGDALHVLAAAARRRSFGDELIRRAADRHIVVRPDAPMPTRFGSTRKVTCGLEPSGKEDIFVQALASANFSDAYDHAKALFSDSSLPKERRVAVIQADAGQHWHRQSLDEVSVVIDEPEWDDYLADLAA
jgi:hypothetical protein